MLVCYVSGHGFGHAVRVITVLKALRRRCPKLAVQVRSPAPAWLFESELAGPFSHTDCRLDVGVIQTDSLSLNPEGTLRAYEDIVADKARRIEAEVRALAMSSPRAVFADIPALAFDVASACGIPGIGMSNFSWDWIYADYARGLPRYAHVVEDLRGSYAHASSLLRLPMHGDLSAFPRIRDIPLVARKAAVSRRAVRQRLGLRGASRIVLLSFGGIGIDLRKVPPPPVGTVFVWTQGAAVQSEPPGCRFVSNRELVAGGMGYEDLVGASDVVMTKPGYGIVADCVANQVPMIYTSRGRFAEYACLVEGIRKYLPHAFLSNEDLYAGRWGRALDEVFSVPRRFPAVETNGADIAAELLAAQVG